MRSIWEERSFGSKVDLIVVGAGITGLFTALHYKRQHPLHRVLVLERGPYPAGASVKNAGFACFGSPSELLRDIDTEGPDVALARVEQRWRGLLELRKELGDAAIGFEPVGGYEVFRAHDPLHERVADRLDTLNTALKDIFGQPVFTWKNERAQDMGLGADRLAWNSLEGAVDSGALMRTLLQKVRMADVEVRTEVTVERIEEDRDDVVLRGPSGIGYRTAHAVLATNGYSRNLVPDCGILPARGQVVLTAPIPGLKLAGTFHMDEGYYYFRHFQGRVLLGGGRHLAKAAETTMEDGTSPIVQDALMDVLRTIVLPGHPLVIEHRWSGVMGFREQGGPPLVERISPHVILAAGLGGIGVAIGIRMARQAAELIDHPGTSTRSRK